MSDCRPMRARLSRNVATTVSYRRGWTAVVTRNILVVVHTTPLVTTCHPLLLLRRRRQLPSPVKFCQRLRTGRMKCCQRLRNGTMTWRWTYQRRLWLHLNLYHREVRLLARLFEVYAYGRILPVDQLQQLRLAAKTYFSAYVDPLDNVSELSA